MKFKYTGPHDAVDLVGVGVVEHGHAVEVDDPDVSASLKEQAGWEHVPDPKRVEAGRKAAETRGDDVKES